MEPEDVTFQYLQEITDDFSEERELGRGSFGVVYKGLTKHGNHVAVKKLRNNEFNLSHKQFQDEFYNLWKLQHENIVRLYGYCYQAEKKLMEFNGRKLLAEEIHRALCLEYMHNGSLVKHLSDESSGLTWNTRYKIMKGICEGLKHMHEELEEPLLHLDLKPANILLDKNMIPKLADFGLSRIFRNKEITRNTDSLLGTPGYRPPEYIEKGEISKKFDIFSLGVVMIEIVSGSEGKNKRNNMLSGEFIDQVKINWRNRLKETWNGSSLESYCRQIEICTQIALNCLEIDTQKRPDIVNIIDKLNVIEIDSGKHLQKRSCKHDSEMTIHEKIRRIEPNDIIYQKQSSSCEEVEPVDIREKSPNVGEEFIVGRKEEKKKIMALIKSKTKDITILPIYGIGGIGKTTFAKLIYNDTIFNDYSRAWVYVSPRFDLNKVGNSIISQLSVDDHQINETHCQIKETKMTSGKKILIVLDDLWEENPFQLRNLMDMLKPGDSINTIVLVTTRSERVAEIISTNVKPHRIKFLTNGMCWDIIKQRSGFDSKDHKEQLMNIGKEIALKCGGVALAAQSLGFMLEPMKLVDQWIEIKDNEIWSESISQDGTLPNHVLASLRLSCTKMDPCLMSCFTYCAIFPKGHHINKEDLIYQWISLGFIKPTELHSIMQLCERYIVQLLGRSFLQHPMSHMNSEAYKKGLTLFTMHDLVHDLARLLIVDKILDANNTGECDYRYAWLTDCTKSLKALTDSPITIRAMHFGDGPYGEWLKDDAFLPAKYLQVLDLSQCFICGLPASIGELVHLRYLNAPRIQSKMLPDSLTKLTKLIYLNLSRSKISALPDSIGEIKSLMHLDISECWCVCALPESFVKLKSLVRLDLSHCPIKFTTKAFGCLTNIHHLNLSGIQTLESDGFEWLKHVIQSLTELRYLGLSLCFGRMNPGPSSDELLSLIGCICSSLRNLVHLDLSYNYHLVTLPESIKDLTKLHTLVLSGCSDFTTLPNCMEQMDSLKILDVSPCSRLDKSTLPLSKCNIALPYFKVHANDGESSSNIGLLWHVHPTYVLRISGLDKVMAEEEAHSVKLNKKKGIHVLSLEWSRDAQRSVEDMEVLGNLVPPETLSCLELRGYNSVSFPSWVMGITDYFPNLCRIKLWELRKCNSLPPLGQLPRLQEIVMGGMDSVTTIEEGFCCASPGAFRELTEFSLCQMENLEVWNTTYSYGQDDVQGFMFPNLKKLLIQDCPKLRLKPCPPKTKAWVIKNSDKVLSSWDEEGEIDHAALLSRELGQGKLLSTKPGSSYNACLENLEVKSSKVPFEQWRLFHHLLPTYQLRISCCAYLTSSSQEIIQDLSYIKSLDLDDDNAHPELPKWLGELISLRNLSITNWTGVSDLPESMRRLTSLQTLRLEGCPRIAGLPEWLGDLASLNKLTVYNCKGIESLPDSIQKLTSLKGLRIGGAEKLKQWSELMENKKMLTHIKYKELSYVPRQPTPIYRCWW